MPDPNDVIVSFWSEYDQKVTTQRMSMAQAREQWGRLSEMQKSAYTIRNAEPDDYK